MSFASFNAETFLPTAGPAPPTLEVVKNTGSIASKSRSSRMRSISTEPTMPRQRIGDPLAGDVGRRAVDRLVQALARRVERSRRQHPDRARQHRRLVGKNV